MNGIYFFLNGDRGIAVARAVVEAGHKVAQIFVPADREDSAKIIPKCEDLRVPVAQVKNVNSPDFVGTISRSRPRLLIIGGLSTIFRRSLIDTAELGAINLHAQPARRAVAKVSWRVATELADHQWGEGSGDQRDLGGRGDRYGIAPRRGTDSDRRRGHDCDPA